LLKMKSIIAVVVAAVLIACVSAGQTRFVGKIVLVTGGSSGIGYQTALQFAQEGAEVVITARDSVPDHHSGDKAAKAINEDPLVKSSKGKARFFKADLTVATDVQKLFNDIRAKEGKLDFAVNAAGISGPIGSLAETAKYREYAQYDPVENNVYALLRAIAEEEALMVEKNISGSIVNVAAIEGVTPSVKLPRYGASKYATIGITNSIALTHITGDPAPYIRINSVAPACVGTPFLYNQAKYYASNQQPWEGDYITNESQVWKESVGNFTAPVPMARVAEPKEVANTILWLCTDEAIHISADTVIVDGGVWSQ